MTLADEAVDASEGAPGDRRVRRIRLTTVDDAAAEIARVYRDARSGKIKTADASRLVFMLAGQYLLHRDLKDMERDQSLSIIAVYAKPASIRRHAAGAVRRISTRAASRRKSARSCGWHVHFRR